MAQQERNDAFLSDMPVKPAAIFWDMDGTLTDSEPLWEKATYEMSEQLGRRLTSQLRELTVGATFDDTFALCCKHAGYEPQPGDAERYREKMFARAQELYATELRVFPGIRDLLEQLHADGIPMLITTNTQRVVADPAFEVIGLHYFVDTICGDEVPQGKPAPDMYLEAARRVGAYPSDCLVLEDSTAGMNAALAAGCQVVGLPGAAFTKVPEGAVRITELHDNDHVEGATSADVYRWYRQLRSR